MQETVTTLLNLSEIPKPDDAADALAVSLTHAFSCLLYTSWNEVLENFKKYCHLSDKIEIKPAKFLNEAGVIGAGRIAMERLKNEW